MAWRKHFTTFEGGKYSPLGNKRPVKTGKIVDNTRKYHSWLPDVYAGLPNRLQRYSQYDSMDLDSEVNTALDTISEFSTQIVSETNLPFSINWLDSPTESESEILQTVLQQWCTLNEWNMRLFKTFRNCVKYGDQPFIRDPDTWKLYYVNPNDVTKVVVDQSNGKKPSQYLMKNIDINFQNLTASGPVSASDYTRGILSPNTSRISANPGGLSTPTSKDSDREYQVDAKHVVHLSLSDGMDEAWPFGTSILDPIFKTYKQKELLEDSIIIYRVHRAPERRIFTIDVGDMPEHLAMAYVERVKNEIHQRRIPSRTGGGQTMMDAQYNPLSINEDYFFASTADGRGSSVDTLPGGDNLGQIDDLKFFTNKMARALGIPSSYLPTGPDDGTAIYDNGKLGSAFIQEFRFSKYCERLQATVQPTLGNEFKKFLKHKGYDIDPASFEIKLSEPQSFSKYREIDIDQARVNVFGQIEGTPFMSKQFAMKKYLGLTDDEILMNEKLWRQENTAEADNDVEPAVEPSTLSNVGVHSARSITDFAEMPDEFSSEDDAGEEGANEEGGRSESNDSIAPPEGPGEQQ
jgi:hypothetical protein